MHAGDVPVLEVGPTLYGVLGSASALKLGLWLYCRTLRRQTTMVSGLGGYWWVLPIWEAGACLGTGECKDIGPGEVMGAMARSGLRARSLAPAARMPGE